MATMLQTIPAVTTIAQTIQLSLSPVFLLAGIGAVLNVLAGRLSRVVDRARVLEALHPNASGAERTRYVRELRLLSRRMGVINAALSLCVSSAIAVCAVVALLFIAEIAHWHVGQIAAWLFIVAMSMIVLGLVMFLLEVRLSLRATHIRPELLDDLGKR